MLSSVEAGEYYDEEEVFMKSPGLVPFKPKTTPSPTPPPPVTQRCLPPPTQSVSSPSPRVDKRSNRRKKTRPTQGDWVLIREMAPNQPEIAQRASEQALNSSSEDEDDKDDMPGQSPSTTAEPAGVEDSHSTPSNVEPMDLEPMAQESLASTNNPKTTTTHRDSVLEEDVIKHGALMTDRRMSQTSVVSILPNGAHMNANSVVPDTPSSSTLSPNPPNQQGAVTNGFPHGIARASSPSLRQLQIPQSSGPDTLPAMQAPSPANDGMMGSPNQPQSLPGFQHIDSIARSATSEQETSRANSFHHRQSISSVGQSPTAIVRQLSLSSHSPGTPFPPLSASSPISVSSDMPRPSDIFLRSSGATVFGTDTRRPSHAASEGGPYPSTLHSASISESYQSSEGLSPGAQQTPIEGRPRHMSLDGTLASRTLPPPLGSSIGPLGVHASGTFRCDYPQCNAAPFQTQYLLNSHANVHSQSRPHYCPVKGCPRGEGGKGFKRKNEMIRHGLVHQSPGYVCPFCPDREHKYPRPDNLQRHVRVHHVDKDKDDAQLREVLAQRPEGGSRGRRRRISS